MSWQLGSTVIVATLAFAGLGWYERSRPSSKLIALVAALAAVAVAGRVVFTPIPNVQATTDVALFAGYAVGAAPAFAVGAIAALASNFFLGQGPWTPWEMLGWGAVGVAGAALARAPLGASRPVLVCACAIAGLAFGAWMDLFTLVSFAAERSGDTYLAISVASLPFNLAHAIGNALIAAAIGPAFIRLLLRYRRRFEVEWKSADAAAGVGGRRAPAGVTLAAVLAAGLALGLFLDQGAQARGGTSAALRTLNKTPATPDAAANASPACVLGRLHTTRVCGLPVSLAGSVLAASDITGISSRALRYLERGQNGDGGFGGAPGQGSSQLISGWAALGLEAGGRNPLDVRREGRSPIDYMRVHAGTLRDTGELERTILVLGGAGVSSRRFAGRDLLAELLGRRRQDGSFEGQVNWTAFGVLALRSAGRSARSPAVRRSAAWLDGEQNGDGGFSFATRGASDVDDTGAALQALAAAGRRQSKGVRDALQFLRRQQNDDGGFGQLSGSRSNAQSTAWAVQGIVAAGKDAGRFGRAPRSPLGYLRSLQQADGSFRYSRTSVQTPVWVTAQALAATRLRALPIAPVRRATRAIGAPTQHAPAQAKSRGGRAARASRPAREGPSLRRGDAAAGGPAARPGAGRTPVPAAPVAARGSGPDEPGGFAWPAVAGAAVLAIAAAWLGRRRIGR